MPNEQDGNPVAAEQNVPSAPENSEASAPPAPTDLAEAFAQLRKDKPEAAQDGVEDSRNDAEPIGKHAKQTQDGEQQQQAAQAQQEPVSEPAATAEHAQAPAPAEPGQPAADAGVGGTTDSSEPVDYSPARQQVLTGIQQQAIQNVVKRFQENNIRPWDIADLYKKDEQTGRVEFANPDDPNRPFTSRKEAQDFVDSMNKQINDRFRNEIRQEQNALFQSARPTLSMLDFVPVYQSLNDIERQVFDDLITPYAIRDNSGNIQGFNTDLMAAANQARTIATRFAQQPQQQQAAQGKQQQAEPTSPATDMTTGTGEVATDEPKDLSEAFALINKQKKEGKKNG